LVLISRLIKHLLLFFCLCLSIKTKTRSLLLNRFFFQMDSYFTNWTNQSWIDPTYSTSYQYLDVAHGKNFSNPILDKTLTGQDKDLNDDEADYMFKELKTFSIVQLVNKIRDIHNMTYELGVNEGIEMTRARLLNIFDS